MYDTLWYVPGKGHCGWVQLIITSTLPMQSIPPHDGAGLVQVLLVFITPPSPHVCEHVPTFVKSLHPPLTALHRESKSKVQWKIGALITAPGQQTVAQILTSYISLILHGPAKHSLLHTCRPTPQVAEHGDDSTQLLYTGSAKMLSMLLHFNLLDSTNLNCKVHHYTLQLGLILHHRGFLHKMAVDCYTI